MHIEPGVVTGAKLALSYATGAAALGYAARLAWETVRRDGAVSLLVRSVLTTGLVFCYFEVLPHHPVGVSEVHLIMGTTLYLLFGLAPAAIGLAAGLLIQGLFFAPSDLPQYFMNVTTLLVPLYVMAALARRVIPPETPYKDIGYGQALKLSVAYQSGIVSWVVFWSLYGHGFTAENLANIAAFAGAYVTVIVVEPVVDLAVLAGAKFLHRLKDSGIFTYRLFAPAA
jgi:ABC-type Co2+ transport system permease subunit